MASTDKDKLACIGTLVKGFTPGMDTLMNNT